MEEVIWTVQAQMEE